MLIIPAIDIRGGKCVRLTQGRPERETIYGDDPVAMAERWVAEGAEFLHVVDLDGAFEGKPANARTIVEIAGSVSVPVQAGGGFRTEEDISSAIAGGVARVVVSTRAIQSPEWLGSLCERFPGQIAVSLDSREGKVALRGWTDLTDESAEAAAARLAPMQPRAFVITDVARDGTLSGPNLPAISKFVQSTYIPVIASGGISSASHVRALARLALEGVIIGKALYVGTLSLQEAIVASRG